jgi:hypothetical protein
LLHQISEENHDIRPAVIGKQSAENLDEYKRFRHVVRNVYTFSLSSEKMAPLIQKLPALWKQIRVELTAFSKFLDTMAADNI